MPSTSPDSEQGPRSYSDDLRDLGSFVVSVRELLQAIVEDGRYIPEAHRDDVRAAWIHARRDFDALAEALRGGPTQNGMPRLESHGLTGDSLRMKLQGWRSRFFRFGKRMNRPWLQSVLRWSDTILGSLVEALSPLVPGVSVVGAAAGEFTGVIENYLADSEAHSDR